MSKNPILPLYYNDIDRSTRTWTDEEFGAYMRLLIEQWDKGGLPNSFQKLTRLATSLDSNWPMLKEKFPLVDGVLKNPVMEEIREKIRKHSEKQKENVRKRYQNSTKHVTKTPTKNLPLENEYENEIEIEDRDKGKGVGKPSREPETEEVYQALIVHFGIKEITQFNLIRELDSFCMVLQSKKQIPHFIEQFKAYQAYKAKAQEKTHNFKGFIGTIENGFEDGGWCADNWVHKLNNFKENGTKSTTIDKREEANQTRRNGIASHYASVLGNKES